MRRRSAEKRTPVSDPKYDDKTVARFVNYLMRSGKKKCCMSHRVRGIRSD